MHQQTLRDAVGIVAEFRNRINSTLTLQLEEHEEVVFLREHIALNTPMLCRQVSDVALGVLYKMCRSIMPKLATAMRLLQLRTPERRIGRSTTGCSTAHAFGSDFDGIVIHLGDLDRPFPRADEALAQSCARARRAVIDPAVSDDLTEEVEQSIRLLCLRAGDDRRSRALARPNVRTLQRRLEEEGRASATSWTDAHAAGLASISETGSCG